MNSCTPLANQPNERWHYSIATDILARVLEVVSGKPLGALLQHEIFDTLDMPDTQYFISQSERHRLLPMYGRSLDEILALLEKSSQENGFQVESLRDIPYLTGEGIPGKLLIAKPTP